MDFGPRPEARKIYVVTAAVACFFIMAQRNDSWAGDTERLVSNLLGVEEAAR
jgi:hypothetical protein